MCQSLPMYWELKVEQDRTCKFIVMVERETTLKVWAMDPLHYKITTSFCVPLPPPVLTRKN